MTKPTTFKRVRLSLKDLLGRDYTEAVCEARSMLTGEPFQVLRDAASARIDFYPRTLQTRLRRLLPRTGEHVCSGLSVTARGASTRPFDGATKTERAPLSGLGYYRVGEDGRLRQVTKSEHYHAPLGHSFPGYKVLETARRLGIPNATHNSTRGYITRRLEERLVNAADCPTLNRVLNLETGSLAVEAALKMALARFYAPESGGPAPLHKGKLPVILVLGNDAGELQANYHGTTLFAQTLRGMWPGLFAKLEGKVYHVQAVRPNSKRDLREAFRAYDQGKYKIAAFLHEIVMMNYGGLVLNPDFLKLAYELSRKSGAATIDDEIQSCLWHHDLFMFKEWGLTPDFVAVGKGFPGGEYPASRILCNADYDTLPQFGALVTNGQEEIASLAYLVTMAWAEANADVTRELGDYFESRLRDVSERHRHIVAGVNGKRHMVALIFRAVDEARRYAAILNEQGIDISVQDYKTEVPPAALLKLPLIMDRTAIESLVKRIDAALSVAEG